MTFPRDLATPNPREGWSHYAGSVTPSARAANQAAGLPSGVSDAGYAELGEFLARRAGRRAAMLGGGAPVAPAAPASAPAGAEGQIRVGSVAEASHLGFVAIAGAPGMFRRAEAEQPFGARVAGSKMAHSIWEMRDSGDGSFAIVRLREERDPEFRTASAPLGPRRAGFERSAAHDDPRSVRDDSPAREPDYDGDGPSAYEREYARIMETSRSQEEANERLRKLEQSYGRHASEHAGGEWFGSDPGPHPRQRHEDQDDERRLQEHVYLFTNDPANNLTPDEVDAIKNYVNGYGGSQSPAVQRFLESSPPQPAGWRARGGARLGMGARVTVAHKGKLKPGLVLEVDGARRVAMVELGGRGGPSVEVPLSSVRQDSAPVVATRPPFAPA